MSRAVLWSGVLALGLSCTARADTPVSVATLPPSVVQTWPAAGTTDVDPSLKEIRVQFSKDMADGRWSWVQVSSDTFPTPNGDPRYAADKRNCTLPVSLKPDMTYVVWVNSDRYTNFRDVQGLVAVPYQLAFHTRP